VIWVAGAGLGLLLAASAALVITGLAALVRRRWRSALATLLGLAVFAAYLLMLAGVAFLLGPHNCVPPTKIRQTRRGFSLRISPSS
jgi:hypothetical protein